MRHDNAKLHIKSVGRRVLLLLRAITIVIQSYCCLYSCGMWIDEKFLALDGMGNIASVVGYCGRYLEVRN